MNDTSFEHKNKEQNHDEALNARLDAYGEQTNGWKQKNNKNQRKKRDPDKPKVPRKISARYLHNAGLAYLQRFATSSAHFKTIMIRKIDKSCRHHIDQNRDECIEMLDTLIPKFQDLGLLDDDAYIHGVVTSSRRRGLSAMKIKQKLMQKGVPSDDIISAIRYHDDTEYEEGEDGELNAALTFMRKKKFGAFDTEQKKDYQKSLASMARSGFQYGIVEKVLNFSMEDIENEYPFIL